MISEQECLTICPHFDHKFKEHIEELADSAKPKEVGLSTWISLASVVLVVLGMLWSMATTLGQMQARQVATDAKIDLILGAIHLAPSAPTVPTSVSVRQ